MNEHLYRSRDDRIIAGVAGGLAETMGRSTPRSCASSGRCWSSDRRHLPARLRRSCAIVVPEEASVEVRRARGAHGPPIPNAPRRLGPGRPRRGGWHDRGTPATTRAAPAHATAAAAPATAWTARLMRASARHAAREARRAARRERGENPAAIVIGAILIIIGARLLRAAVPAEPRHRPVLAAPARRPRVVLARHRVLARLGDQAGSPP